VAQSVVHLAARFTRLVTVHSALSRRLRNIALPALGLTPELRRAITMRIVEPPNRDAPRRSLRRTDIR
jgi:hypothetical protein